MKKIYNILLSGMLMGNIVHAQTLQSITADGNNKTSNGIGVINGSEMLACSGDFATGNAAVALKAVGNNTNGGYTDLQTFYHGIGYNAPLILNKNGGSVGIGTINPIRQFTLANTGSAEMVWSDLSQGADLKHFRWMNANQKFILGSINDNGTGPVDMLTVTRNGNVGIGTNEPAAKLSVAGQTYASLGFSAGNQNPEGLRIAQTNTYIGGWNSENSVRTGFLQFNAGYNVVLSSDGGLPVHLAVNGNPHLTVKSEGNVGIGTLAPAYKLDVNGDSRFSRGAGSALIVQTPASDVRLYTAGIPLTIPDANVGIGTVTPGSYRLAVEGTIGARKLKITQEDWADYVFDSAYQLQPLYQIEKYIQEHKHLPEMPSAAEVKKEGLDVGDNQALLLKKIEELTLYIIQQNKRLDQQDKVIAELKAKVQ